LPYPGEAFLARELKPFTLGTAMPNALIALLLLLGGANRPNEALRPHAQPRRR
jgi:hypothetical protein